VKQLRSAHPMIFPLRNTNLQKEHGLPEQVFVVEAPPWPPLICGTNSDPLVSFSGVAMSGNCHAPRRCAPDSSACPP
jgi:hypothetical protein